LEDLHGYFFTALEGHLEAGHLEHRAARDWARAMLNFDAFWDDEWDRWFGWYSRGFGLSGHVNEV